MILEWVLDHVIRRSQGGLSCWSRLRRGVLVIIGVGCVALGLVLMGTLVRAETLGTLGTAQLLGIVVLIACPALSLGAIRIDRAAHQRVALAKQAAQQARVTPQPVCVTHDAHQRPLRAPHHVPDREEHHQPTLGAA